MIVPTSHDVLHLRWPAERFYWAILDTSSMPVTVRNRRARLGYLFESVLPDVTIEQVQTVYQALPGGTNHVLACGLPKNMLIDDVDPSAVTLTPNSAPSFLETTIDLTQLNLLRDSFLPQPIRRLRRRWLLHAGLIFTLCAALLIVGLERRTTLQRRAIIDLTTARDTIIRQVLGSDTAIPGAEALPGAAGELRLIAQRRRLQQTRSDDLPISQVGNASAILARLLALWPQDLHAQTQSISITSSSITLRASVPTMTDAQRLADAFSSLNLWRLQQPQSEARRDRVDVTLRFESIQELPSR